MTDIIIQIVGYYWLRWRYSRIRHASVVPAYLQNKITISNNHHSETHVRILTNEHIQDKHLNPISGGVISELFMH